MSKKKQFFSPSQMVILTGGTTIDEGTNVIIDWAKPDPNLDGEDDQILLPDGSVGVSEGDVVIPDTSGSDGFAADEAYY